MGVKDEIVQFLKEKGGYFRRSELAAAGFNPQWVYHLEKQGIIERVGWGIYKLSGQQYSYQSSLIEIPIFIPKGVICLRSTLAYYDLTTYNPPVIDVAVSRIPHHTPKVEHPPVKFWFFSPRFFTEGIIDERIGNGAIKIYNREKTICDCFRLRNKIGLEMAREGLEEYLKLKDRNIPGLIKYAEVCRVKEIIRPYLDAML